ncbi:hypothetical protein LCGC14_2354820, partial [marine sediment metagenome]
IDSYSSQHASHLASNVIDDNSVNSSWLANGGDTDQWVIIDLGASYNITGFKAWGIYWSTTTYSVKNYRIGLSNTGTDDIDFTIVASGQIVQPSWFGGRYVYKHHTTTISNTSARYVKYYLDDNWGYAYAIGSLELEIYSSAIQQDTTTITSDSEIYYPSGSAAVTSDGYIVSAPIVTEIATVTSNAEITDLRRDVLSDAFITINVYSNAHIVTNEVVTVQSDAMIYRSGSAIREVFTMGKGSFVGFPDSGSTLIYCTNISSSDEVIVADMITSSIMNMTDITPPLGYQNYAWKYDWVVRTYDSAQYKFEIRTGETKLDLLASTFSSIVLGQIIPIGEVPRYHQWRCHIWASGSGDFELHQFSIKGYVSYPANLLYSSLNSGEFTAVSKVETNIDKPYEPMNMDRIWDGSYIPGDVDGDGIIDYNDILYMNAWLNAGGPVSNPIRRADVNDSGGADIADLTYLTAYIFLNGSPPYRWDASGLE